MSRAKKAKMGRPPLPQGMVRETFTLRITPDERATLERAAEKAGKQLTQWARDVLLERAAQLG